MLIGATPEGRKELVGFTDGARENAQDWRDLLLDLKRRGLNVPPQLVMRRLRRRQVAATEQSESSGAAAWFSGRRPGPPSG